METQTRSSSVIVFSKLASVIILFNSVTLIIAGIMLCSNAALVSFNFWLKIKRRTSQEVHFFGADTS